MRLFILFYFLGLFIVNGQSGEFVKKLDVFPVSPEAASLGKYGEIPVNLSTGKINYQVPLYTIKVKDFEWPIYMSYNYSGLLVEQDPSILGLGWDLMANGRITREIKGIPDEMDISNYKSTTIVPYLKGDYNSLSASQYKAKQFEIYDNIANLNKDGQFDNYIINAGEVSGNFTINENNETVFQNHRNYIAAKDFVIDDRGVKYFFDEIELGQYNISSNNESVEKEVPSSRLLTKIELPNNNGEIIFEYEPFSYADVYTKIVWTDTQVSGIENKLIHSPSESQVYYRPLKKITFPNGEVRFTITAYDEMYSNQHGNIQNKNHALEELSVHNTNNKEIVKYSFVYNNINKSKKVLKEILKSVNNNFIPFYKFNYIEESFLNTHNFDYTAQDFWGYYNARTAPNLIQATLEIDTLKTKIGALEKIEYPTKGYTLIEYEQNKVNSEDPSTTVQCSYTHNSNKYIKEEAKTPFIQRTIDTIIDVGNSQIVKIVITAAVKKGTTFNALGSEAVIEVNANNASSYCGQSAISNFSLYANAENCSSYSDPNNCQGDLILTKEIIGYAEDGIINISGYVMEGRDKEAYVDYKIYYEVSNSTSSNKNVGGIRVSRTTDCDDNGDCYPTNYMYTTKLGKSSGSALGGTPQYKYSTTHSYEPSAGGGTVTGSRVYVSAKSKFSFTSYQGAPVIYERVIIQKNNGENGRTINNYSLGYNNINPGFPFLGATNYDWMKGKLMTSYVYQKQGGIDKLIQLTTNEYDDFYPYGIGLSSTKLVFSMDVGRKSWRYTGGEFGALYNGEPSDYVEDYNYYFPKERKLVASTIKNFINNDTIITTNSYLFDVPYLQIQESINSNSEGDFLKQKYYYPYSESSTANSQLVSLNNISAIIKEQKLKVSNSGSNKILNTVENKYYNWGNNRVLPITISSSKGSNSLTSRINYQRYDSSGNPLEVSQADGPPMVYIWGYSDQQPIAKIENATYQQVASALSVPVSTLDTYTEANLAALNALRNNTGLSQAMITTYTYEPLVGVKTITDPKGFETTFEYDAFNRLEFVKDADGNIIKEHKYNYKGE